ncbi:MAG TPA: PIN domain-containing protein [Pyrinomonadaceae bacterium]|nr:PIN domain-containing protein [Pyrinomonadaceae bacterium]
MRTLIDTSFVVALVNDKDEDHEKALELSIEFNRKPLIITDAVLLEIGNSLSRRFKGESIETIQGFFDADEVEIIRLDETLFINAFKLYKSHTDKTWGLVDCVSFVVMKEHNIIDALTSDKHFVQAGFRALMLDSVN